MRVRTVPAASGKKTIIERYHDLRRIENSFRITMSDLEARPIFQRLDETITAHLVIVFAGLAIARYIEIKTEETAYIETTVEDPILKEKIDPLGLMIDFVWLKQLLFVNIEPKSSIFLN